MAPARSCGGASTSSPSTPSTTVASACTTATFVLTTDGRTAVFGVFPVYSGGSGAGWGWDGERGHDGSIEVFFQTCRLKRFGKFRADRDGGTHQESTIRYGT